MQVGLNGGWDQGLRYEPLTLTLTLTLALIGWYKGGRVTHKIVSTCKHTGEYSGIIARYQLHTYVEEDLKRLTPSVISRGVGI